MTREEAERVLNEKCPGGDGHLKVPSSCSDLTVRWYCRACVLDALTAAPERPSPWAIGQLRHLYAQMVNGQVRDMKRAATGLLGPAIEALEASPSPEPARPTIATQVATAERILGSAQTTLDDLGQRTGVKIAPAAPPSEKERTLEVKQAGCTDGRPCLKPFLRWVHSAKCREQWPAKRPRTPVGREAP